jgi:hypothetical protein
MIKYFVCQRRENNTYILLPDNWSGIIRSIISFFISLIGAIISEPEKYEFNKTILGPNRLFLHINVRPLRRDETEPTILQTSNYFEGLLYRQNLFEGTTGKIKVLNKDHFTAKYYRINKYNAQYIKKYCLYINGLEYLFTAVLANVGKDQGRPDEDKIIDTEKVYDGIIQSLYLVHK